LGQVDLHDYAGLAIINQYSYGITQSGQVDLHDYATQAIINLYS